MNNEIETTASVTALDALFIEPSATVGRKGGATREVRYQLDASVEDRQATIESYLRDELEPSLLEGSSLSFKIDSEKVRQKFDKKPGKTEIDGKSVYRHTIHAFLSFSDAEGNEKKGEVLGVQNDEGKFTLGVVMYEIANGFSTLKDKAIDGNVGWGLTNVNKAVETFRTRMAALKPAQA